MFISEGKGICSISSHQTHLHILHTPCNRKSYCPPAPTPPPPTTLLFSKSDGENKTRWFHYQQAYSMDTMLIQCMEHRKFHANTFWTRQGMLLKFDLMKQTVCVCIHCVGEYFWGIYTRTFQPNSFLVYRLADTAPGKEEGPITSPCLTQHVHLTAGFFLTAALHHILGSLARIFSETRLIGYSYEYIVLHTSFTHELNACLLGIPLYLQTD